MRFLGITLALILGSLFFVAWMYGVWILSMHLNYAIYYESTVKETVRKMVKEDSLKPSNVLSPKKHVHYPLVFWAIQKNKEVQEVLLEMKEDSFYKIEDLKKVSEKESKDLIKPDAWFLKQSELGSLTVIDEDLTEFVLEDLLVTLQTTKAPAMLESKDVMKEIQ